MIKKEIIKAVCLQTGCKQDVVEKVIEAYTAFIINRLLEKCSFRMNRLGTLRYVNATSRNGYNPVTKEMVAFDGKNRIKFIPSKRLANMLNPQKGKQEVVESDRD